MSSFVDPPDSIVQLFYGCSMAVPVLSTVVVVWLSMIVYVTRVCP